MYRFSLGVFASWREIWNLEMTSHGMPRRPFSHLGFLGRAYIPGLCTAGMKVAARGRIERAGNFAFKQDMFPLGLQPGIGDRHC